MNIQLIDDENSNSIIQKIILSIVRGTMIVQITCPSRSPPPENNSGYKPLQQYPANSKKNCSHYGFRPTLRPLSTDYCYEVTMVRFHAQALPSDDFTRTHVRGKARDCPVLSLFINMQFVLTGQPLVMFMLCIYDRNTSKLVFLFFEICSIIQNLSRDFMQLTVAYIEACCVLFKSV